MKNTFKTLLLIFLLKANFAMSQTTTIIDYGNEQLDTTACNALASPKVIDGFIHRTSIGRPKYSDNSILLNCQSNSNTNFFTTQYYIQYSFRAGYTYKISVYYKGKRGNTTELFSQVALKISTTNGGVDSAVNCVGPTLVNISNSTGFTPGISSESYAWANNLVDVQVTQNAGFLLVGAIPYSGTTLPASILVRQIKIIETPPPVSFTLPSSTSVMCGSTAPVTFNITNVNNTTSVTGYTWNLGSANNGWKLSTGEAAPATIPTSIGSLTLTPTCGSALSNILASVTANGISYNTNTNTTSISTPSFSINGPNPLCSQATYSLSSTLPCGGTVTWSSSNTNVLIINSTTGFANRIANGTANIIATINSPNPCVIAPILRNITAGIPIIDGVSQTSSYVCVNARIQPVSITFSINNPVAGVTYNWVLDDDVAFLGSGTSKTVFGSTPGGTTLAVGQHTVSVRPNVCSNTAPYLMIPFDAIICGSSFLVSPNPADGNLTLKAIQNSTIENIRITDVNGKLRVAKSNLHAKKELNINIGVLPSGIYRIEIFDGKKWEAHQIIKQ